MSSEIRATVRESRASIDRSFPITSELDYRLVEPAGVSVRGRGWTQAMSSTAVWLESDRVLRVGVLIELAVAWPVRLDNKIPLRLIIHGRTVSAEGNYAKVEILRHEFRTRAVAPKDGQHRLPATAARTFTASA